MDRSGCQRSVSCQRSLRAGLTSAVRSKEPSNSAIKAYIANGGEIEGVTVKREYPPAKLLHP
jgi:hypothetical protein